MWEVLTIVLCSVGFAAVVAVLVVELPKQLTRAPVRDGRRWP